MSELIPLLWELDTGGGNGSGPRRSLVGPVARESWPGIPTGFVPTYVEIHGGKPDHDHAPIANGSDRPTSGAEWRTAQSHWEVVVAKVLDTDVVKPNVSGEVAIRRAVHASALLLDKMARQGRCPICPHG